MEDNRRRGGRRLEETEGDVGDGVEDKMDLRLRKSASNWRRSLSKDCCVV